MYPRIGTFLMADAHGSARLGVAAALMLAAGMAGGCGVRGPLEAPKDSKVVGTNSTAETPADPGKDSAVKPKPHQPFILDGLIR